MSNFNSYNYANQMNNKFQFVPPPKLPFQNIIPSNSGENNNILHSTTSTQISSQNEISSLNTNHINNINYSQNLNNYNGNNIITLGFQISNPPIIQNSNSVIFNTNNQSDTFNNTENQKQDFENNKENKNSLKNTLLSKYIEKDNQWFKNWYNSIEKSHFNEINSYKKMKYTDVLKSFSEIYNNIQTMKDIKKHLEENQMTEQDNELQLNNFNEKINSCNLLQVNILSIKNII